jgi:IclR family transcriptional regulator, acetate operon repressor
VSPRDDTPPGQQGSGQQGSGGAERPVLVLRKLAAILDALEAEGWGLPAHRVASLAGLPASTAQRLLASLVLEGFLERLDDGYFPGRRLVRWRAEDAGQRVLIPLAQPVLDRLRDETGETALLFARDGLARAIIAMAPTRHAVVYAVFPGQLLPLHAGSSGRVLLAFDPEAAEEQLRAGLPGSTPATITDPGRLRADLAGIRGKGYAVSIEERAAGAASVSAPVFGRGGQVIAALGIAGPTQRLDAASLDRWCPAVLRAARELSRALGHTSHFTPGRAVRGNPGHTP